MQIKGIKLRNIRSYLNEEIEFPEGTVMLSGDIGSGKSTILYAIDFALFGITKDLSGSSLLRHGAREGTVELNFEVDGKNVVITRNLRRGESVTQSFGSIVVDGTRRELTAVELKQKILELLQYPQELLTKKSLIYRYTVYTPQDEMKSILLGDDAGRVDTLRKVFGIDKYKRIGDNAEQFLKQVRSTVKNLREAVSVMEERKQELNNMRKQQTQLGDDIGAAAGKLTEVQKKLQGMKQQIMIVEKELALHQEQQKELKVIETALEHYRRDEQNSRREIPLLEGEVNELEKNTKGKEIKNDEENIRNLEEKAKKAEERIKISRLKMQECIVKMQASEKNIMDIEKLDKCPLCKQSVSLKHKQDVKKSEEEKINENKRLMNELENEEKMLTKPAEQLKLEIETGRKRMHERGLLTLQMKLIEEKRGKIKDLTDGLASTTKQIEEHEKKQRQLMTALKSLQGREKELADFRENFEEMQDSERHFLMEKVSLEKEKSVLERDMRKITDEIERLEKQEMQMNELSRLHDWIDSCFVKTMEVLERRVMLKVHHDFDSLFQKWFGMLVESELMKVRLDDAFSPVIEQNGYETDYSFLSGGEKTAAALAYRLALNQVINNIVGVIKTRDLLILDEPTDGFSSEQLDRMRGLIDELDAKQIILVSHEDKIESFVNTVIRIEKQEHVSKAS